MSAILEIMMAIALLSTGLFAGLMMTLVVIMQKQWKTLDKQDYIKMFGGFLLVAKNNPVISMVTLSSAFLPLAISISQIVKGMYFNSALSLLAGLSFLFGCLIVTLRLNFPIYNRVISWGKNDEAAEWEEVRNRFYKLNVIRLFFAVLSFFFLTLAHIANP